MRLMAPASLLSSRDSVSAQNYDEMKVFASRAATTVLEKIGSKFEEREHCRLNVICGFSPELAKRIISGESFDLIISPSATIDALIKAGKVSASSKMPLLRSGLGVEVKAGADKPDVSTVEAFKRTLLAANSVGYLPNSGVRELLARLHIENEIEPKSVIPSADIVSELVSKGEIEVGVVVITQILTTPGVELAGVLPSPIQFYNEFFGAISTHSADEAAAVALLRFLIGPEATTVVMEHGMEQVV